MPRCALAGPIRRQRGAALLLLMVILVTAALALLLDRLGGPRPATAGASTMRKMAIARDALIGRAATDDNRPGSLPCPDTNDDGVAELFSGTACPAYLGRLPWKTLKLGDLRDDAGERFWYALSPSLRDNALAGTLNAQTGLELSFDGQTEIAAIVFSPGPPDATQNGRPDSQAANYLDGSNRDADHAFVSGPQSATFNDQALAITRDELFGVVNKRVLAEIRGPAAASSGLRRYFAAYGAFPWADGDADGIADPPTATGKLPYNELLWSADAQPWLSANGWLPLIAYARTATAGATIAIGGSSMTIPPCPATPCP